MIRIYQLLAVGIGAAIVMSSCGGGGTGSPTPHTSNAAPVSSAHNTVPVMPASARQSVGTAHLVLKLPAAVTGKTAKAIRALHGSPKVTAAASRSPKYVNPTSGSYIDIFVDGSLIPNIDNEAGANDSILVQQTSDGTQSVSVPLFSTNNNEIVVVEWDPYHDFVLAEGETDVGNFSPGISLNPTVTLLMNAQYIGILDIASQQDPEEMYGQTYYGLRASCGYSGPQSQFGIYSADGLGTFVPIAGYGGTSVPSVTATPNPGGTTTAGQTTIPGIYQVTWDTNCDGVSVTASAQSPAAAITQSVNDFTGGYNYYGYYYCYYDDDCPGGPYQGLWNFRWLYNLSSLPSQYEGQAPSYTLNGGTVSGTVDITASPPP